jgi:hypothetical protein
MEIDCETLGRNDRERRDMRAVGGPLKRLLGVQMGPAPLAAYKGGLPGAKFLVGRRPGHRNQVIPAATAKLVPRVFVRLM